MGRNKKNPEFLTGKPTSFIVEPLFFRPWADVIKNPRWKLACLPYTQARAPSALHLPNTSPLHGTWKITFISLSFYIITAAIHVQEP